MTIEEMRQKKQELGYSYEQIAELANLPLSTVQKVFGGITKSPRYDTLKALEQVFDVFSTKMIAEPSIPYGSPKKQGEYTVEDYMNTPEDMRLELIDGVIYDMATPTIIHQIIGFELCKVIRDYIQKKKGNCIPIVSPVSVQLDCDDKTILEPDVVVVCDRDKFKNGIIFGAPDFVVEVLSPSTRKKDLTIKHFKYMNAGVREYWIIDPVKKNIVVYDFETLDLPEIYTFEHKVPVKIFNGECLVDFKEIFEYIEFLY
ncbi:MAG: Uma2 family endonuclease [Lachnospiraceae bacterium]|nr:Uma2 family endonuclease [Lachnospiraceae bacterium]